MVYNPCLPQPAVTGLTSFTGIRGSVPKRVHTNPLSLLKNSLEGQDLWTVTGIISTKDSLIYDTKVHLSDRPILVVNWASLEPSDLTLGSVLAGNPSSVPGQSERRGGAHYMRKKPGKVLEIIQEEAFR